jgi:hypothetical protein
LDSFKSECLKYEERSIKEMKKKKTEYGLSDCKETEREIYVCKKGGIVKGNSSQYFR